MGIHITVIADRRHTQSALVGLLARPPPRRMNKPLRAQSLGLMLKLLPRRSPVAAYPKRNSANVI
jgi:hypothetical protein